MGAFSWSRDKGGTGKSHVAGAPVVLPSPAAQGGPPPAKRARVWKREDGPQAQPAGAAQVAQPAQPAAGPSQDATDQRGRAPHGGESIKGQAAAAAAAAAAAQDVPRRELRQDCSSSSPLLPGQTAQQQAAAMQQRTGPAGARADHIDDRGGNEGNGGSAQVAAQQAELEALRQRILEKQAHLQQSTLASRVAEATEKQRQKEARRQRLEAGFAKAFAEAKEAAFAEISSSRVLISFADEREVQRVLACKSDYDVLRLQPGADAAAVKRRYREMAVALHPDKCRAAHATDAFQRLVRAYQSLLQFAR